MNDACCLPLLMALLEGGSDLTLSTCIDHWRFRGARGLASQTPLYDALNYLLEDSVSPER